MRAGTLRLRVNVQAPTETQDSFGDVSQAWVNQATSVPASIVPLNGREFERSAQTMAEVSHKITIRYSSAVAAITPKWRILYGSRTFDINAVVNVGERDKAIELFCVERV